MNVRKKWAGFVSGSLVGIGSLLGAVALASGCTSILDGNSEFYIGIRNDNVLLVGQKVDHLPSGAKSPKASNKFELDANLWSLVAPPAPTPDTDGN